MNTETGQVYTGQEAIDAARARGEQLARVSQKVARLMMLGRQVEQKRQAKAAARQLRKRKAKQSKADRKRTKRNSR